MDQWLLDIKEVLDHPDPDAMAFLDTFKLGLFAEEMFVFTPAGDIKTLPLGATVLDFAYQIHSELGEHCIGAKVNHKMESLSYRLESGDQIEILTSQKQQPEPEWLNLVVTAKAQNAIKHFFNKQPVGQQRNTAPKLVKLLIRGTDNFGVLVKMLNIISEQMHLNMKSLHTEVEETRFECMIELFIFEQASLSTLCAELKKIPELTDVEEMRDAQTTDSDKENK